MMEGVIVQGRGGLYTVRDAEGNEYVLRAKKKFRRQGMSPLVGDRIDFTPGSISDEHGWIEEIHPRISQCLRPRCWAFWFPRSLLPIGCWWISC